VVTGLVEIAPKVIGLRAKGWITRVRIQAVLMTPSGRTAPTIPRKLLKANMGTLTVMRTI
jgi:hypothetical protein